MTTQMFKTETLTIEFPEIELIGPLGKSTLIDCL
jgi:hypothetical protein